MASIHKEILINAPVEDVWDALRDWGALHERLAPGFVTDVHLDGSDRIVTFFTGAVARELLVDLDDETHRLVWSVAGGPYTHHNGSAQACRHDDERTRFVWIADLLPNDLAPRTAELMEQGLGVIKKTLESKTAVA